MAQKSKDIADEIRAKALASCENFIRLCHANRVLGEIHQEILEWADRPGHGSHQLLLMPRDHMKSALIGGYWAAWQIVKNPAIRILYISSTANLAVKQLKFIKDILTCDAVRRYWPELVNKDDALREKWTENEISVDHPLRKFENVRDPTVFTAGLTTNIVGMHADLIIGDDLVTNDTAYTEEGRNRVKTQYSFLASIGAGEVRQFFVGTRYHPKDLYNDLINITYNSFNSEGEVTGENNLYEVFRDGECVVEDRGDGTGVFLWPRQRRHDGKWFGFNVEILAKKRAGYLDKVQFRAQYYNDPNDPEGVGIDTSCFQYYDRKFVTRNNGQWYFKGSRLNLFASIDFAFTINKKSDYTAIVVVGVDGDHNYYVLDIDRIKSDQVADFFKTILRLHQKWDFRKIRAEVTAAQITIVTTLRNEFIRPHGLALSIDEYRPTRNEGSKSERIRGTLQPRYQNKQMWHYQGGYCQDLEEELVLSNPAHDDIKDALASCVDVCLAPSMRKRTIQLVSNSGLIHPRFGGMV